MNRTFRALVTVALTACCALTGCTPSPSTSGDPNNLELISWWTSGSEADALTVLIDANKRQHPDVTIQNAAVAGGGGSNARVVLATRLAQNDPPDLWQAFPQGTLEAYVSRHQVADVSAAFESSGMAAALPPVVLDGLTFDGRQYGMPTSAHRGNVLFFNKDVLAKAGVAEPSDTYTVDAWLQDMKKVKDAGVTPLCLGAKDAFTTSALFENILQAEIGTDGWAQIQQDRFNWSGPEVNKALETFGTAVDMAGSDSATLTWDAAVKQLAAGQCAFDTQNDSAYGELLKDGGQEGTTFGDVPFPGTAGSYNAVVDIFVARSGAPNTAVDFLGVVGTTDTQTAFSKIKGSVPARTDADPAALDAYEQKAYQSYKNDTIVWSITHGEAMNPRFQQGFYDGVAAYLSSRDTAAFGRAISDAVAGGGAPAK